MTTPARLAAAAFMGVLLIGGAYLYIGNPGQPAIGGPEPSPSVTPSASATPGLSPSSSAGRFDATTLRGWIVFVHFGKAPDGSTPAGVEYPASIWLVHADGTGLHEMAPGVPADGKFNADISPDGRTVAFNAGEPKVQTWEAGIEGGAPRLLSTACSGEPNECMERDPAYSPDGRRMAFVRAVAGDTNISQIGIRELATGAVTLIGSTLTPFRSGELAQPTWSPDGGQIGYATVPRDPTTDEVLDSQISIVQTDGTGLHQLSLPAGTPWGDLDWSPDGSRILLSSWPIHEFNDGRVNVYSAHPDGSDLRQLTNSTCGGCGAPSWTPDGAHILFWGPTTFWLMEPDGSDQRPINEAKLTYFGDTLGYGYYAALQPTP